MKPIKDLPKKVVLVFTLFIIVIIIAEFLLLYTLNTVSTEEPESNSILIEVTSWDNSHWANESTNVFFTILIDQNNDGINDTSFSSDVFSNANRLLSPFSVNISIDKDVNFITFRIQIFEVTVEGVNNQSYFSKIFDDPHIISNELGNSDRWIFHPDIPFDVATELGLNLCAVSFYYYVLPENEHDPQLIITDNINNNSPRNVLGQGLFISSLLLVISGGTTTIWEAFSHTRMKLGYQGLKKSISEKEYAIEIFKFNESSLSTMQRGFIEVFLASLIMICFMESFPYDVEIMKVVVTAFIVISFVQLFEIHKVYSIMTENSKIEKLLSEIR